MSDSPIIYGFEFGLDYADVLKILNRKLKDTATVRPVVFLFAPSHLEFVKRNILNLVDYLHFRSGDNIEFFCLGYEYSKDFQTQGGPFDDYGFDAAQFNTARQDFETRSSWKYSGETDLLIMNAYWSSKKQRAYIDLSAVIQITLERAIEERLIASVPSFFEKLNQIAEKYHDSNPTYKISDLFGLKAIGKKLYDSILSLIPGNKEQRLDRVIAWRVKDLTPNEVKLLAPRATDDDLTEWQIPEESIQAIRVARTNSE